MKLETFFEKFDQFADAPDAVDKMRELVLALAVQGKVADQDPQDEPAAKLLQRLVSFKQANPLSGRSGRSKEEPAENEPNSEDMPANWVNTTIGEVLYVIRGASPRPKGDPQYFSETRTPYHWVKISDIRKHGQNGLLMDTDEFLTEAGMRKSVLLPKGTLVLTNSATIGVPIVLGIEGCCIHDGYLAFPNFPHDLLSQKFLLYLFHTLKKHAERNARGLAQLNLNTDLVRSFPFGLPPLAEQKRIVAKVDELMALCDRLALQQQERETRHAALARASLARFADAPNASNLKFLFHESYSIPPADLRKSILTLAVQGKLVPQDPNDEPASRVLARIDAAPKRAMRTRATEEDESGEPTELGPLFELPPGWEWAPFRRLPLQASVGIDRGRSMQGPDKAVGYFKMNNIRNSGGVDLSDLTRIDATPDEIETFALADGDFLFNTRNSRELVGKTCVFRASSDDPILYNNNILRVKFIEGFSPDFLDYWFRSPEGSAELEKLKSNTTNVCAIYQGKLSGFPCAVPPLAEQRRIVAKVEQLMALVDALETQLAASRATAAKLLDALVAELTAA